MSDSTFKIFVTTDNHLGFAERDPRRGDDSFTTFEELLRAARTEHDVDLMLLGGDLFHENKPSLGCLVRSCSLFRKYVYGNKDVPFSLLSDPAVNFPTHALPMANFQDPNINVALPVFAIHGNHDDPVGGTSSLDVLATNGYINYFGHTFSLEEIVLEPVLLRKGGTFLALYGLGNVRDERLHRCFRLKKVHVVYPRPVPGRKWFNILLLHQNRGVRGAASKNGILESMLSGLGMDLAIWGNEHEQLMVPQPSHGFDVVQPGSSVLTSLSAQECNPKQYGILEIRGTSYRLTPYTLRSVRPVVRRTVALRDDLPEGRTLDAVETYLHGVMRDLIGEAEEQVRRIPDDVLTFHPNLKYPLVRLAVDFTDLSSAPYPQPNFNRFGQQYMDVVANPGELLRPVAPKPERRVPGTLLGPDGSSAASVLVPTAPQLSTLDIRVKVADVFNHNAKNACALLSESELSAAVYAFAEKGERDAIDERLMELLHTSQKSVWRRLENGANDSILNPDRVAEEVVTHKRHVNERYARAAQLEDAQQQRHQRPESGGGDGDEEGEEENQEEEHSNSNSRRRRETARRSLDMFETVRVANVPATDVKQDAARPPPSGYGDVDADMFGTAATDVATLVQQAIHHGEALNRAPDSRHTRRGCTNTVRDSKEGGYNAENEGEELPADGLGRVSIDSVVAQAVQQQQQQPSAVLPPSKRPRSRAANAVHTGADAGDVEDDEGVSFQGSRNALAVDGVDANTEVAPTRRGGGGERRVANSTSSSSAASKRQRTTSARGGGGGATAKRGAVAAAVAGQGMPAGSSGAGGGPTLTLMAHQGVSDAMVVRNGAAARAVTARPPACASRGGAMLDLLSKWTDASQQR